MTYVSLYQSVVVWVVHTYNTLYASYDGSIYTVYTQTTDPSLGCQYLLTLVQTRPRLWQYKQHTFTVKFRY